MSDKDFYEQPDSEVRRMDEEFDQFNQMDVNRELLRNSEFDGSDNHRSSMGQFAKKPSRDTYGHAPNQRSSLQDQRIGRDSAQTANTAMNQKYLDPTSAQSDLKSDLYQRDSDPLPKQDNIYDYYYNDPMANERQSSGYQPRESAKNYMLQGGQKQGQYYNRPSLGQESRQSDGARGSQKNNSVSFGGEPQKHDQRESLGLPIPMIPEQSENDDSYLQSTNRKDNQDDFRPMRYYPQDPNQERNDGALDSARKSNRSFAEAVESEISENQFKAVTKAHRESSPYQGREQSPSYQSQSHARNTLTKDGKRDTFKSLTSGHHGQQPFIDEKLSNIEQNRNSIQDEFAPVKPQNEFNKMNESQITVNTQMSALADAFDQIDTINPKKTNINKLNDSLANAEEQSFNDSPRHSPRQRSPDQMLAGLQDKQKPIQVYGDDVNKYKKHGPSNKSSLDDNDKEMDRMMMEAYEAQTRKLRQQKEDYLRNQPLPQEKKKLPKPKDKYEELEQQFNESMGQFNNDPRDTLQGQKVATDIYRQHEPIQSIKRPDDQRKDPRMMDLQEQMDELNRNSPRNKNTNFMPPQEPHNQRQPSNSRGSREQRLPSNSRGNRSRGRDFQESYPNDNLYSPQEPLERPKRQKESVNQEDVYQPPIQKSFEDQDQFPSIKAPSRQEKRQPSNSRGSRGQRSEPEMARDPPVGTHQYQQPVKEFKDVRDYLAQPSPDKKKESPHHTEDEDEYIDVLKCTVKIDTNLGEFESKGGAAMFRNNLAYAMGIDKRKIKVRDIREGSVIIDYDILIDNEMPTKSELGKRQDQIFQDGLVDLGGPIIRKRPSPSKDDQKPTPEPRRKDPKIDQFEREFKEWQDQKQKTSQQHNASRGELNPSRGQPNTSMTANAPVRDEIRIAVEKGPNNYEPSQSDFPTTTNNMANDISEGYEQEYQVPKSVTGPLNTTLGGVGKVDNAPKYTSMVQIPEESQGQYPEEYPNIMTPVAPVPAQLQPQRRQPEREDENQDSFVAMRKPLRPMPQGWSRPDSGSGGRMSKAARGQQFADGRQSRSGSRGRLNQSIGSTGSQSELHKVSVVQTRKPSVTRETGTGRTRRSSNSIARDEAIDRRKQQMAHDQQMARQAQEQMELQARKRRLEQQQQLLAGFKNSKIDISKRQNPQKQNRQFAPQQNQPRIANNEHYDVLQCSVRLGTTMKLFQNRGGTSMFINNLSQAMDINQRNIKVRDVREGSVIIDYDILIDDSTPSKAELQYRQDQIIQEGIVDLGGPVISKTNGQQPQQPRRSPMNSGRQPQFFNDDPDQFNDEFNDIDEGTVAQVDGYSNNQGRFMPREYTAAQDTVKQAQPLRGIQSQNHRPQGRVAQQQQKEYQRDYRETSDRINSDFQNQFSETMHMQQMPSQRSKQKAYEDLYLKVIEEQDPKEALNREVMRDKQSFEYYKEGIPMINQWIDQEMRKRNHRTNESSANRLMGYQRDKDFQKHQNRIQAEKERLQQEMKECSFQPQTRSNIPGRRDGSFTSGRKMGSSRSPARFATNEDKFNKRRNEWVARQNEEKDIEIDQMHNTSKQHRRDLSRSSNVSGHGSFMDANYYNSRNNSMTKRSNSKSNQLQEVLNRSGSRNRFFNNTGSSMNRSRHDSQMVDQDPSSARPNDQSDAQSVRQMHREFTDIVKRLQYDSENLFLVDILQEMKFINAIDREGQETRLGTMLRQQRNNLMVGNQRTRQSISEFEDVLKNLFKFCCSIMNYKPIRGSYNLLDQQIMNSYLGYLDVNQADQDVALQHVASVDSTSARQVQQLLPQQIKCSLRANQQRTRIIILTVKITRAKSIQAHASAPRQGLKEAMVRRQTEFQSRIQSRLESWISNQTWVQCKRQIQFRNKTLVKNK